MAQKIQATESTDSESVGEITRTKQGNKIAMDVSINSLGAPSNYDDIVLTYTGDNLTTVVWKLATVTIRTATLSYTGSRLDEVVFT